MRHTDRVGQVLCPVVVGRAGELRELRAALDRARDGRGGCVLITGEAGIGKSRLVRELRAMAAERGLRAVSGRAVPAAAATAYRPLAEALIELLGDAPLPEDPALRPWLPQLAAVLPGVVDPGGPVPAAGGDVIRGEAVLRLLRASSPQGVVVLVEDLHWSDPDTVALLEYLADHASMQPVLLAVSLRCEPGAAATHLLQRLRGRAGVVHLPLERLGERDVVEMVTACHPGVDPETRLRVARVSDGVPLLVEELLASPGIPGSIAETVRARLAELGERDTAVLEAAAVLGRRFDWALLAAASGQRPAAVTRALGRAVALQLLTADDGEFRFRHALTREAVLAGMLPPRVREVAGRALSAVDRVASSRYRPAPELAAELAALAGQRARAGRLLAAAGRYALQVGALATAAETLRRAVELLDGDPERTAAQLALVEALALAGRVDEAATAATALIDRPAAEPAGDGYRAEAHLHLARAAVAAARWPVARQHVDAALALLADGSDGAVAARAAVLSADILLAGGDLDRARVAAEAVLALDGAGADTRCHAYEIVGRAQRLHDLPAAAAAFEAALVTAQAHDLPLWRMRALHELGTVDIFARADVGRLLEARGLAEQMAAVSTVAVLDLQLSATFTARWELEACDAHATAALDLARHLGLHQVAAKALALLAGSASLRGDLAATERFGGQAVATDPGDPMLGGFCRASVGMALLMSGDTPAALRPFAEGTATLSRLATAEPISIRALWPLVQAAQGDPRAAVSIDEVRRAGADALHVNRGMIRFAQAVLAGRNGRADRADALVAGAAGSFVNCEPWADLTRFLAAGPALRDGWGDPVRWLHAARDRFAGLGLDRLAERCAAQLAGASANPWAAEGVTAREADVLRLVLEGRANKEIASVLCLSPRTVEKHVESLLRKTGARSRTDLALSVRRPAT